MPNGHGGIPRYPVVGLILLVVLFTVATRWPSAWLAVVGHAATVAVAWRACYGRHLWKVSEYGGAYADEEAHAAARSRFLRALPLWLLGGGVVGLLFWLP